MLDDPWMSFAEKNTHAISAGDFQRGFYSTKQSLDETNQPISESIDCCADDLTKYDLDKRKEDLMRLIS